MKRIFFGITVLLVLFSFSLAALPESSGKLAGTETAFIDDSWANIGLMDSTVNIYEIVSLKSNLLFDAAGLYNFGIKAGYRFRSLMDIRIAAGYTWFLLNEDQFVTGAADSIASKSGIGVSSLDFNIQGQKIYAAFMVPVLGLNLNANFSLLSSVQMDQFMKGTVGIEKLLFNNHLSVYANGGMFFNLPESTAPDSAKTIFYNNLVSSVYADGGMRVYMGDHFNLDLGFIYPGVNMPLGTDAETGAEKSLNLPVFPVFNIAYRL